MKEKAQSITGSFRTWRKVKMYYKATTYTNGTTDCADGTKSNRNSGDKNAQKTFQSS